MSSRDRRPYLTANILNQDLLNACHDNLETRLEMICEIETPLGKIYASDRNKYVGSTFYEALLNFPKITRTVGEWISNSVQFSTLQFEISNVTSRFNDLLPSGTAYAGWVGKNVVVKLGLADKEATYFTIFDGTVTDIGGFKRTTKSIIIVARDKYDRLNSSFPTNNITEAEFPKCDPSNLNKLKPVIYGDWTKRTDPVPASVFGIITNGLDPAVNFTDYDCSMSGSSVFVEDHFFENGQKIQFTENPPAPLILETDYFVVNSIEDSFQVSETLGGAAITIADGNCFVTSSGAKSPIHILVSGHAMKSIDTVFLKRSDIFYKLDFANITISALKNELDVSQNFTVDGDPFKFDSSDEWFVGCKGFDLGAYSDNIVAQSRHILETYGGATGFDGNWISYRDKSTPAQSAISTFKSRVYISTEQQALSYALSMLEQVRLEAFIDKNQNIKLNSLHFEDWDVPAFTLRNFDIVRDSVKISIDERNNFNAARAVYNFLPDVGENAFSTAIFKNQAAIDQAGKRIAKQVVFPNLYIEADVVSQLKEVLKLSSATLEVIDVEATWRSALRDIGEILAFDVTISSLDLLNIPAMIRDFGFDPNGLKVVMKLWLLGLVPHPNFPTSEVGGFQATIDEEI